MEMKIINNIFKYDIIIYIHWKNKKMIILVEKKLNYQFLKLN